jgi:hypothetical protein
MSQLQKLLNAHIEYEVAEWKGDNLKNNLKLEVESLYDTIGEIEAVKFKRY